MEKKDYETSNDMVHLLNDHKITVKNRQTSDSSEEEDAQNDLKSRRIFISIWHENEFSI